MRVMRVDQLARNVRLPEASWQGMGRSRIAAQLGRRGFLARGCGLLAAKGAGVACKAQSQSDIVQTSAWDYLR